MFKAERGLDMKPIARDTVAFRGHPLVSAQHPTTIEVTTDSFLTQQGDCIVGVSAEKGCAQIAPEVKSLLRKASTAVVFRLVVNERSFEVAARGDPKLTLTHPHDIVIRRSGFISDRTIAVRSNAAAVDIPRDMVEALRNPETVGRLEVEVS